VFFVAGLTPHDLRNNGKVYLDYIWRDNEARSEAFDLKLITICFNLRRRGIRIRAITDEAEQGGKTGIYRQHLEQVLIGAGFNYMPEIYQFNRSGTRKDIRIREAAEYWLNDFVRIYDDCPEYEHLRYEMTHIGRSKWNDVADAAADVFRSEYWTGRMYFDDNPQPPVPIQPGDDVLKENLRFQNQIKRQLYPEMGLEDLFPEFDSGESRTHGGFAEYKPRGPW